MLNLKVVFERNYPVCVLALSLVTNQFIYYSNCAFIQAPRTAVSELKNAWIIIRCGTAANKSLAWRFVPPALFLVVAVQMVLGRC